MVVSEKKYFVQFQAENKLAFGCHISVVYSETCQLSQVVICPTVANRFSC